MLGRSEELDDDSPLKAGAQRLIANAVDVLKLDALLDTCF